MESCSVSFVPVVLDESVQRVGVRHPRQQPRVGGERDDGEPLDGQVAPEGLRVVEQERVDEAGGKIQQKILTFALA